MTMKKNLNLFGLVVLISMVLLISACASTGGSRSSASDPSNSFEQHVNLAKQYIGRGNRNLARTHLIKAERLPVVQSKRSQLYNAYGLLYQTEREFALAEEYYRKGVKSNPQDAGLRYNFATFLLARGRAEESIEQMSVACDDLNYHRRPQGFFVIGLAYNTMSDPTKALAAFNKTIQLNSGFAPSYLEVSKIYLEKEDYQQAKVAMDLYFARAGDTAEGLWQLIQLNLAMDDIESVQKAGDKLQVGFPRSEQATQFQQLTEKMVDARPSADNQK